MRWDDLFADLEGQWDALAEGGRQAEIVERTRAELARVTLLDRLRGTEKGRVRLSLRCGHDVAGALVRVGADFVLVESGRQEIVVPVDALVAVRGLGATAVPAEAVGAVRARLGLASVLRRVAADRSLVTLVAGDARPLAGTLRRVGADFVELVEHPAEEPPRRGDNRDAVAVPFGALVLLRRGSPDGVV